MPRAQAWVGHARMGARASIANSWAKTGRKENWSAVRPSKVNGENGSWHMGEFNFCSFSSGGHLGECSTICRMSAAQYGQMGE